MQVKNFTILPFTTIVIHVADETLSPTNIYWGCMWGLCFGDLLFGFFRKRCITSENQFDFLKDLVANVPDLPTNEEEQDGEPKPKRWAKYWLLLMKTLNWSLFRQSESLLQQNNVILYQPETLLVSVSGSDDVKFGLP